jgi:hypothetical protein
MTIRHFSINTATTTAAVQSDDHRLHCTTRSDAPLTVALARKCRVSVICCHMLSGSWAEDYLLALLESRRWDIWDVPRRKSQGDLGRVSEQVRKTDHRAQSVAQEKQRSGILVRACWSELEPRRAWTTSFSERVAVTAQKSCMLVLSSVQEVRRKSWAIMSNTTPDIDEKSLLVALFECCVRVFICPNMVVMAVDNTLSSKEFLICAQHNAGEPRLCSTALEKPLTKLLSPGVVRWAHCLNFLPIRVQLLLMHNPPNGSVRFMNGVSNLACAGWRCVSNHVQDRFLIPRSEDSPPPSTIMPDDIQRTSLS